VVTPANDGEFTRFQDKEVLRILLLGGLREIERPRNNRRPIYDHNLVVSDAAGVVGEGRYARVDEKSRRRVFFCPLALIQDNLYLDPSLVGLQEGFAMGRR
jgi:hypothetical protein